MRDDKNYGPCTKDHMREFRTLEECGHDRLHRSTYEAERDEKTKLPQGHQTHKWSVEPRLLVTDELRQAKVMRTRGDWDGPSQGLDTPRWRGKAVKIKVMPSQGGRDVRSCSRKLQRAEFYGPQWHRRGTGSRGSSQVVNFEELRKAMES